MDAQLSEEVIETKGLYGGLMTDVSIPIQYYSRPTNSK